MNMWIHRASLPLLLLLAGCMPSNILILPEPTDDAELVGANKGVLVAQVADTTPFGAFVPVNQLTLAPKDVEANDESKYPRMTAVDDASGASSKMFYAILPAGDYSIASLRSYHSFGESWFSRFYPAGIELGTFTVMPGQVTDLGILAVYIRRSGEDYLFETVRSAGSSRGLALLGERVPGLLARIENRTRPHSWNPDGRDEDRRSEYVNAVNRQIVFADPNIDDSSGAIRFPSRLGVIVQRAGDGEWSLDAIPRDVELLQVVEIGDSDVVVTEFGDILARSSGSTEWRQIEAPAAPDATLKFVDDHPVTGVYAVTQQHDTATIWSATALGEPWTMIETIERQLGFLDSLDKNFFFIDHGISGASYLTHGDYLYLALGKDIQRFDMRTQQSEALDTPNPESVQLRNGILTIRASGFAGSRVSFDSGNTWQRYAGRFEDTDEQARRGSRTSQRYRKELRSARFVGHPVFIDKQNAFAIHEELNKNGVPFLIRTDDGAQMWRAAADTPLPEGCAQLVMATPSELLLSCFLSGEFYRSTDAGQSWVLDRDATES